MEAQVATRKIAALPPEAQAIVLDIIEVLDRRYAKVAKQTSVGAQMAGLKSDPFVGMWRDRPEMTDAVEYVRTLRHNNWKRKTISYVAANFRDQVRSDFPTAGLFIS